MFQHEKMSAMDGCQQNFLRLYLYRQPFNFLLPDKKDSYRTFLGSLLSLLTVFLLIGFATYKLIAISTNSDYKIQVHDQKFFYDASDEFTFQDHEFMIGAAITAYDGSSEDITDPEIGEVKFYMKKFGDEPIQFVELPSVPCKDITTFG